MLNPTAPPKVAPDEMTSTQVKSNMMDMLDDARAGYVSYITRNGRPAAAVVPVAVGRAYETQTALPEHIRTEITAAVDRAHTEITAVLTRLHDHVRGDQPLPPSPAEPAEPDTPSITDTTPSLTDRHADPAGVLDE